MNWLLGNRDPSGDQNQSRSAPDADELRRRRLAKLEEAQAAEKARLKELEERKAKWTAAKEAAAAASAAAAAANSMATNSLEDVMAAEPVSEPPPPPPLRPAPSAEPQPKRIAPSLPSVESMVSRTVSRIFALALDSTTSADAKYYPDLVAQLRADSGIKDDQPLLLNSDAHADDILLNRINEDPKPLEYLFACYARSGQQMSDINSNRKLHGSEHNKRRAILHETITGVERRVMIYTGMLLSGAFMELDSASPQAFAEYILNEKVPVGFVRALLSRHMEADGASLDDILPSFKSVFLYIRSRAQTDSKLSSSSFLKPLNALASLVVHKELCRLLTSDTDFVPDNGPNIRHKLFQFADMSYLYPFFQISALPGAPLGQIPLFPEDPSIATSMFSNPSVLSRAEAEGTIFSLRSSLSVARNLLSQICLALCKAGPEPRDATLSWFAKVFNLNTKRAALQPDPRSTSRDGFMMNVMFVLLKLCEPIVSGGWRLLQKIDPTYPQSSHRIDYSGETRLAADTDMLKRWWVDKRNQNAQESLTRQLEVAARESGLANAAASSDSASLSQLDHGQRLVGTEFNFVTECFWMALRGIQLGFIPVVNVYEEQILGSLQRIRDVIKSMEAAKESGSLPPAEDAQLTMLKRRFDMMLQAKLCYDVYMQDAELLTMLVRFVTADAEWIMKRMLLDPNRESALPLPLPVDPTFASLPEHTVETITAVLLTTMHTNPRVVMEHSSLLDEMVSFCVVGSASPLHIKNPYLRAKLVEFLSYIFPKNAAALDDEDDEQQPPTEPMMEALFAGHHLSRRFLPGSLFRLYVDVEHTGSHTQFYDKFSIRYRIGSILESLWFITDYRKSVRSEARDEGRFLRFVNMVLNDANHLLDSVLDDLEEMRSLETLIQGGSAEWESLSEEEKREKQERLQKLEGGAKSYNQLANNNVKLLWLLTGDEVVRRIFLRDEMVSRLAEMLNYLLERLCGQRCSDLKVSDPAKVSWKPRQLLKRIMETYTHFVGEDAFAFAVARDGRSYKADLFTRATAIAKRRHVLTASKIQGFSEVAEAAARAHEADNEEEEDLGDVPDEFLDPVMSVLMRNPVKLPTSGNVMDRAVISRILLSDKLDPFNRKLLTEDMLVEDTELKEKIDSFIGERRRAKGQSSKDTQS